MQDFYLEYKKVGRGFRLKTNLTDKMLQNRKDYDEEWMFIFLGEALKDINNMGDEAKEKYKLAMSGEMEAQAFYDYLKISPHLMFEE